MNTEQQLRLPSLGCLWLETACCRDLLLRAGYHSLDTVHNKHTEVPGHSTTVNPNITVCVPVSMSLFFSAQYPWTRKVQTRGLIVSA